MGFLTYGSGSVEIEFEDRTLAHLQVVITAKLRRSETFTVTFDGGVGVGRRVIWVAPAIPLLYQYSGSRTPSLNKDWLDDMLSRAGTPAGLIVTPEPGVEGVSVVGVLH